MAWVGLVQFDVIPNVVLLLTIAGVINAGLVTAREWEDGTIKELLMAPMRRSSLIAGKLLAGWLTTLLVGAIVLLLGAASGRELVQATRRPAAPRRANRHYSAGSGKKVTGSVSPRWRVALYGR